MKRSLEFLGSHFGYRPATIFVRVSAPIYHILPQEILLYAFILFFE